MLKELTELNHNSIKSLFDQEDKCMAIRVKGFVPPDVAQNLTKNILGKGFDKYTNAPSIGRIGMAFYEAENEAKLTQEYFNQASDNINDLRKRCAPYYSPIDILRCKLDEIWPAGANLEMLLGKKMYVGLSRVVEPDVTFLAHHDIFHKDSPNDYRTHSVQSQLSCNVYLDMPKEGGALQIWSTEISPDEFDRLRKNSYGIAPQKLGKPCLDITPSVGDLIIFNAKKMHSVTSGKSGKRLSLSCFIGYRGDSTPLTYWS